jgi:hypothetical protein
VSVISCRRSLLSCTWSIVKTREHVSRMKKFDNIILDIYIYCARRLSKLRRSSSCEHHSRDHDTNCVIDKGLAELLGRHGSFPRNICTLLTSGPASMQHAHLTSSEFRVAAKWAVTLCELHQFRSHSEACNKEVWRTRHVASWYGAGGRVHTASHNNNSNNNNASVQLSKASKVTDFCNDC